MQILQWIKSLVFCFFMFTVLCSAVKTKLTWVNGIAHTYEHMENGARPISKCFNKEVDFCYNPTSMTTENDYIGFLGDLRQASFQRFAGKITNEVNTLVEHLRRSIKEVGKNGKIIHIAHSQGAIITALAANNLTAAEMQQTQAPMQPNWQQLSASAAQAAAAPTPAAAAPPQVQQILQP